MKDAQEIIDKVTEDLEIRYDPIKQRKLLEEVKEKIEE